MSNDKNNEFAGEFLTPEIARKAVYELGKVNRTVPTVGIFDAPIRCFKINHEWWGLVGGMVHLLADVSAWQDAQDESYPPIIEILKFMQGVECADGVEPMLRQKPTDDCVLQQSLDGGETWVDAFDFSLCLAHQTTTITGQLQLIEQQNITNSGYSPTATTVTGENGAYTAQELDDANIEVDVCDTAGRDAVYGAVDRLVRYIHTKSEDFLQQVTQAANISQQIDRAISATPVLGLLPADELAGYIGFIVDELAQEYNATVDEDLLQSVICDLFCIAVNSDCHLNFNDVVDYFASKVSPTFSNFTTTFLNLVQFAATGTFSGDDYFYFMAYFQLQIAGTKQRFLDIQSIDTYVMQAQAGLNSPDHDWAIFCTACPQQYRLFEWDFRTQGQGDFAITTGFPTPGGVFVAGRGWMCNGDMPLTIAIRIPTSVSIHAIAFLSSADPLTRTVQFRPVPGSGTNSQGANFLVGTDYTRCADFTGGSLVTAGKVEIALRLTHGSTLYLQKIAFVFGMTSYIPGSKVTTDRFLCS